MGRTVYHVQPSGSGWEVKKPDAGRASSTHRKKSAAIKKAKRLAKERKPSEVIIHKSNGAIHDRHTYGRASDPFPPMG